MLGVNRGLVCSEVMVVGDRFVVKLWLLCLITGLARGEVMVVGDRFVVKLWLLMIGL